MVMMVVVVVVLLLMMATAVVIAVVAGTTESVGEGARGRLFAGLFGTEVVRSCSCPDRGRGDFNNRANVVNRGRNHRCSLSQSRGARVEGEAGRPISTGVHAASTFIPARHSSSRRGQLARCGCYCCYWCCSRNLSGCRVLRLQMASDLEACGWVPAEEGGP